MTKYSENITNGERTVNVDGINFTDTKFATSFIGSALDLLKGERECEKFKLDSDRNIHQFSGNIFIIEYQEQEKRDTDRELFKKYFKPTENFAQSEADGSQVPEVDFKVDYEGKYYLCIHAHLSLNDEQNKEKGVYKGVVFNPGSYFPVGNQVENIVDKTNDIL